jgi:hypothetical protein
MKIFVDVNMMMRYLRSVDWGICARGTCSAKVAETWNRHDTL